MTETDTDTGAEPLYLRGHFAPVVDESETWDLPVTGALPTELAGRYVRNGPNPRPGERTGHWFTGPGMLHGVRLAGGRAEWYRNRWVRTRRFDGAPPERPDGSRDFAYTNANTHLVECNGTLLALGEGGLPYQVTRELETVGPVDFGGRLRTAMTAHPKTDPVTGELHFFGYSATPPYVTYHRLSADGELDHSRKIDVPGPTMMHDFAITEHHVVWLDLPMVVDPALLGTGMPVRWDDGYGARLGVMRRGVEEPVRWYDIDPCYVFHVGNAREDDRGRIVLDAVRHSPAGLAATWSEIGGAGPRPDAAGGAPTLYRWTLDPADGAVRAQQLDDLAVEFPTLDEQRVGRGHRYLYAVSAAAGATVVRYDAVTGERQRHELGADRSVGEAVFVPAADARAEDEGWLIAVVTDHAATGSDLVVLDATDVSGPAVATVRLPRAVPAGFHGSWIADTQLS